MHAATPGTRALPVSVEGVPRWERELSDRVGLAVRAATGVLTVEEVSVHHDGKRTTAPGMRGSSELQLPIEVRASDYTVELSVTLQAGSDGFIVAFGDRAGDYFFEWSFGIWQNRFLVLGTVADGLYDEWTEPLPYTFDPGRTYRLEIRVADRGRNIVCFIDGRIVHDVEDAARPEQRLSATAVVDGRHGATIVKLVNATADALEAEVVLSSGHAVRELEVVALDAPADAGSPGVGAPSEPILTRVSGNRWRVPPFSFATVRVNSGGLREGEPC
jgi:hypothetical protein